MRLVEVKVRDAGRCWAIHCAEGWWCQAPARPHALTCEAHADLEDDARDKLVSAAENLAQAFRRIRDSAEALVRANVAREKERR